MNLYYQHLQEKRHIIFNTPTYDDWLDKLLQFDTTNIPLEHLWVYCDKYWLFMAKQGSDLWKEGRKGRVTGSVLAEACKAGKYGNTNVAITSNPYDDGPMIDLQIVADEILGLKSKTFSTFAIKVAMPHGTLTEPLIRKNHEARVNTKIIELPIAIPVDNLYSGVSIDAYLKYTNIIGEYKAPQSMYKSLLDRVKYGSYGAYVQSGYNHIVENHYYQMHLGMKVFDKQFCDYVVYDNVKTNQMYLERIPFDTNFWENTINPKLNYFIDNYLKNKSSIYPLMPPKS